MLTLHLSDQKNLLSFDIMLLTADKSFEAENTKRMKVFSFPLIWLVETK